MKYKQKKNYGITLIALVITILILVILAGVTIATLKGTNLFNNAIKAKEKSDYEAAKEAMELKLSAINTDYEMHGNGEAKLQFTADKLCEDDDIEYMHTEGKKQASIAKITLGKNATKIYTKLRKYKYEFEINDNIQIASIDGKKVEDGEQKSFTINISKDENVESFIVSINGENEETYTDSYNKKIEKDTKITIKATPKSGYSVTKGTGSFIVEKDENINIKTENAIITNFDYTGAVQEWKVPTTGIYRIECWGASGGNNLFNSVGGKGGYSQGYIHLNEDQSIYLAVGGAGFGDGTHTYRQGGWNGGGNAKPDNDGNTRQASGGGCTSITYTLIGDGQLKNYEAVKDKDVLIVAGGGAGAGANSALFGINGGGGGGLIGGSSDTKYQGKQAFYANGGTQTGPGDGIHEISQGRFGCCDVRDDEVAGAGAGWYGGGSGWYAAGGGSSYIGGVQNGTTIAGDVSNGMPTHSGTDTMTGNSGNGYAKITLISIE